MNFQRLNHILIPPTLEGRERLRKKRYIKLLRPFGWWYGALSDEGRVMSLLLLFVGTASIEVSRTQVYILWALLFGGMLASLLLRPFYALTNVTMEAHAPERISVGADVAFQITMRSTHQRSHHAIRVRGPFLPWDGTWISSLSRAPELLPDGAWRSQVRARFIERGPHHIEAFTACALLPFGLSVGPSIGSRGCRFTVVPRLAPVTSLKLSHGDSHQRGGGRASLRRGEAMEIRGVRPYRRGDPVRDLHHKTWARSGIPHVREYQQETFTRVGVIVDNDAKGSSEAGFEATLSLTAGVMAKLAQGNAIVEALVIGNDVNSFAMGGSAGTLNRALDLLAHAKTGEAVAIDAWLDGLTPLLQTISSVIIVTQSTDPSKLELVAALKQRRLAVRLLRVHDDSGPAFLAKRRTVVAARSDDEHVVMVKQINGGEPIIL